MAQLERHPHHPYPLQLAVRVSQREGQVDHVARGGQFPLGVRQDPHGPHGVELRGQQPLPGHHANVAPPAAHVFVPQQRRAVLHRHVFLDGGDDVTDLGDDVIVVDGGVVPGLEDDGAHDLVLVQLQGVVVVFGAVREELLRFGLVLGTPDTDNIVISFSNSNSNCSNSSSSRSRSSSRIIVIALATAAAAAAVVVVVAAAAAAVVIVVVVAVIVKVIAVVSSSALWSSSLSSSSSPPPSSLSLS